MDNSGIAKSALQALELLESFPWINKFYLAGGTGLALQLYHRLSFDLDFFTPSPFDEKIIDKDLKSTKKYHLDRFAKDTLLGTLNNTKISFFTYEYPLLKKFTRLKGVDLASIEDITAMKLEAIISRATKKDYVDLYFICQQYSIKQCLNFYLKKFAKSKNNLFFIIRSLSYFEDAEQTDMPQMLKNVSWEEIKKFFQTEVKRLAKEKLGV